MSPSALRQQAEAIDRATSRYVDAVLHGRDATASRREYERTMRAADRMIAASRKALQR